MSLNIEMPKKHTGHPNIFFNYPGKIKFRILGSESWFGSKKNKEANVNFTMIPIRNADSSPLTFSFVEKKSKVYLNIYLDSALRSQKLTLKGMNAWINFTKSLRVWVGVVDIAKVISLQMEFDSRLEIDEKNELLIKLFAHLVDEKSLLMKNHLGGYKVVMLNNSLTQVKASIEDLTKINSKYHIKRKSLSGITYDKSLEIYMKRNGFVNEESRLLEDGHYVPESFKQTPNMIEVNKENNNNNYLKVNQLELPTPVRRRVARKSVVYLDVPITATAAAFAMRKNTFKPSQPQSHHDTKLDNITSMRQIQSSTAIYYDDFISMIEDNKLNIKSLAGSIKKSSNNNSQVIMNDL